MEIVQRSIAGIEPYGKNAKKHADKQIQQIANSMCSLTLPIT